MSINTEDYKQLNNEEEMEKENNYNNKIKKIIGTIIIIAVIISGLILSVFILLIFAEKTKNSIIAYIIQFILMCFYIGGITYIGTYLIGIKLKTGIIISIVIFLIEYIFIFIILCILFYSPVDNNSIYYSNNNTYWELSTGSRISYIKYGDFPNIKEYPIIFLHGGPGAPVNGKEPFIDELVSEGFIVYQYDQFGCGNSNRANNPKEYTIERHVSDLEEIRKKIGAEKIILISHSFGGALASSYMSKYNDKVYNSIFISPGPIWEGDKSYEKYNKEGNENIKNAKKKNKRYNYLHFLINLHSKTGLYYLMSENKLDKLAMNFHDTLNMKPGSGKYYNTIGAGYGFWANVMTGDSMLKKDCNYKELAKSDAKCLIIKAQYDYLSWEIIIIYRDLIYDSTLILVDGMGHSVEKEYESSISKNIISFLNNGTTISKPYKDNENPWK